MRENGRQHVVTDAEEIDLHDVFSKLMKRRQTILSAVGICVVVALIYSFTAQPIYSATSRILVEGKPPKIVKVEDTVLPDYTDRISFFNSQIEILNSRTVAVLVIKELGKYEPWNRRFKPADRLKTITESERVDSLKKHVKVSPVRMAQVIKVAVEDPDPVLAARIANGWMKAYALFSSQDQLVQRRSELEADLGQQLKYLKEKHPVIVGLKGEIASINKKIAEEIQQEGNPGDVLARNNDTTNVKVLDYAEVPIKPERPRKALNVALSLVFGFFLGAGLVFLFESLDQTFKSVADMEAALKLLCLVPIPCYGGDKEHPDAVPEFVADRSRHSLMAEALRSLRTGIIYSNPDLSKKTFVVTSSTPSEGKTTVAINLATVFAQAEEKVLLVDTDLRKPRLHSIFKLDRTNGVIDILAFGKDDIHSFIHKTAIKGLDVLTCGEVPLNPSELLGSKKMEELIAKLSAMYDRIIFDTPPILAATDAVVLSTKVDATILVVKSGSTHRQAAQRSAEALDSVHAHVLGAVLNMVNPDQQGPYYYYYHYGQNTTKKSAKSSKLPGLITKTDSNA